MFDNVDKFTGSKFQEMLTAKLHYRNMSNNGDKPAEQQNQGKDAFDHCRHALQNEF